MRTPWKQPARRCTRVSPIAWVLSTLLLLATATPTVAQSGAPAPPSQRPEYRIGVGDVLAIHVFEDQTNEVVLVRPDGRISLPLIGDVEAANLSPTQLAAQIARQLEPYQKAPTVTVAVREIHSYKVYVLGRVNQSQALESIYPLNLLQVLATVGGLNDYASGTVIVLRQGRSGPQRMEIDYDRLVKNKTPELNIVLESGDVVVVE